MTLNETVLQFLGWMVVVMTLTRATWLATQQQRVGQRSVSVPHETRRATAMTQHRS